MLLSCAPEPAAPVYTVKVAPLSVQVSNPKLLIVFYAWGRNNLIYNLFDDIAEMASNVGVLQSSNVDIVLCVSSWDDYYYSYIWDGKLIKNKDIELTNYWYSGVYYYNKTSGWFERVYYNGDRFDNTATAAAMIDNLSWVKSHFDTSDVWLNLWDHGYNVLEMGLNDTAVEKTNTWSVISPLYIGYDEIHSKGVSDDEVTYAIKTTLGSVRVLSFDACEMMILESLYTYKDVADWLVGSMGSLPTEGFNYDELFERISVSNGTSFTIAKQIVDSYYDYIHTDLSNYFITWGSGSQSDIPYLTAVTKEGMTRTIGYIEQTYDYLETLTETNNNWFYGYWDYATNAGVPYYPPLGVAVWINRWGSVDTYHCWFRPSIGEGGSYTSIAGMLLDCMKGDENIHLTGVQKTALSNILNAYETNVEDDVLVLYYGQGKSRYGLWYHNFYYGHYPNYQNAGISRQRPKYFTPSTLLLFRDYPKVWELLGGMKYNINDHRFNY